MEDELASIAAVIGASLGGLRSYGNQRPGNVLDAGKPGLRNPCRSSL